MIMGMGPHSDIRAWTFGHAATNARTYGLMHMYVYVLP